MSLKAEVLPIIQASSGPAYWSAQCGDHTYAGSYTQMMDWAACMDYCSFTLSAVFGQSFRFADILDADNMYVVSEVQHEQPVHTRLWLRHKGKAVTCTRGFLGHPSPLMFSLRIAVRTDPSSTYRTRNLIRMTKTMDACARVCRH